MAKEAIGTDWLEQAAQLGTQFAERARAVDLSGEFVAENYAELKRRGFFKMAIPEPLGGGGASYSEVCNVLRVLGASCSSTALALSMHTHLVAANVWNYQHGKPGAEGMLRKVASKDLVLVSTGATDWIDSNGSAKKVDGGYLVSGRKVFASGCPGADVLITSIASLDEPEGPSVLHFPLPLSTPGVRVMDDWNTLGMRGTGSHSVVIEEAFVSEADVALKRPQGCWHPVWSVVLGVAPPVYTAPYVGLAEAAERLARERALGQKSSATVTLLGKLHTALTQVRLAWEDMLRLCDEYRFTPSLDNVNAQLIRKTLIVRGLKEVMEHAVELVGGASFYRSFPMERLWRDAQAAHFHPLPERRQLEFTGRHSLGLDVLLVE